MPTSLIGTAPNQVPRNADLGSLAYQNRENVTVQNLLIAQKDTPIYAGYQPAAMGLTVITAGDNSSIYDQGRNGPAPAILLANAGWTDVGTYTETNIDFAYIDNNSVLGTTPQARIGVTGAYNPYINSSPYNEAEGWFRIATRGSNPEGRMTDRLLITKDGYSIFNGNVAIGTLGERTVGQAPYTIPTTKLLIKGTDGSASVTPQETLVHIGGNELGGNGGYAGIQIGGATLGQYGSYIRSVKTGSYGNMWESALTFGVTQTGTSGTYLEAMRIAADGKVGIGSTSPAYKITAYNPGTDNDVLCLANNSINLDSNQHYVGMVFADGNTNPDTGNTSAIRSYSNLYSQWGSRLTFSTTGLGGPGLVERMRINANGAVVLQGGNGSATGIGLTFPATQSPSTDANTLDDYEEGGWTPVVTASGGGTPTYNYRTGYYTKVGNLVTASCHVVLVNKGTLSGQVWISGLPFAAGSENNFYCGGIHSENINLNAWQWAYVIYGDAKITFRYYANNAGAGYISDSHLGGWDVMVNITYKV